MKHYVGIDLGTTNSAICSYDGSAVHVWKSPEQNDVTPTAIFVDRRGNRYYGRRAYDQIAAHPENGATLFKRYMGTKEHFLKGAGLHWTPEECSAEILKVLFGYLPEEIRSDPETATVITVPAAFNQMKKDATLEAAQRAGIGKVALVQEPVAAVMSVMRTSSREGVFLVYDLGGGTFDVSLADNIGGKVNLLSQGGKEMCGGRDWDRLIYNSIVIPWLRSKFVLPDDFLVNERYRLVHRLGKLAAEQAKIELSTYSETIIKLDEDQLRCTDLEGNELYLDIPFARKDLDALISDLIDETIEVTRETMDKAGYTADDIEMIVFVGGPTNYKPLRDKVAGQLALRANTDVNPMIAVAEGASIFAESIDWSSSHHTRKAANAQTSASADISFRYDARTPDQKARVAFLTDHVENYDVEIISIDTGWTSGRAALRSGMILEVPLIKDGDNTFEVSVYDRLGHMVSLKEDRIVITRTIASIGAIPASHSIGAEVLSRLGGAPELVSLVRKNDPLPQKGSVTFKAGQTLRAGTDEYLLFKLWEGEIRTPIKDNRWIGYYKISGRDFDDGVIPIGADIICDYEVSDAGTLHLGVSVPCIGADFGNKNHYSRQEGQLDLDATDRIADSAQDVLHRAEAMSEKISDPRLEKVQEKARKAASIGSKSCDQEEVQDAFNESQAAKELLSQVGREHRREYRQTELDRCVDLFNQLARKFATPEESTDFDRLTGTAQRTIDRNGPDSDFENQLSELRLKSYAVLWRQDWFIISLFNTLIQKSYNYMERRSFDELKSCGQRYVNHDQIDELREVVLALLNLQSPEVPGESLFDLVNVIRG